MTETDPEKRRAAIADTADAKRNRMKQVCSTCHTPDYINLFYRQYDDLVMHYNEKFAKPGQAIMSALTANGLITKTQYDEQIEWTWYYLWHHEGRRARMGASMMAPDYTQWHGMFEVAERFYMKLIPRGARDHAAAALRAGRGEQARAADAGDRRDPEPARAPVAGEGRRGAGRRHQPRDAAVADRDDRRQAGRR